MNYSCRFLVGFLLAMSVRAKSDYAIVVSATTKADAEWAKVVVALQEKHRGATVVTYSNRVSETLGALQAQFPRYTCFVATPDDATRKFVADIHQLTRKFDADPYTDTIWGILTGYDASNALRIAQHNEPLKIQRVLAGTPFAMDRVPEGAWYSELNAGEIVRKDAKNKIVHETGPADSTAEIVAGLNEYAADLFITSGHATEHDWQLGYRYKNGQFRCKDGQIFGRDTGGKILPVQSEHPRVYLPVGNCLMGHIAGRDCMALAFMNSAGVMQMAGYTVATWYGYAGWGMLDYFVEQPGRFMLAEAFVANQNALIHRMREKDATAGEIKGLAYDSETFAFYGDPAWEARMADGPLNWEQLLSRSENDTYTFVVMPRYAERTFEAVNTNGSQRGGRPVIQYLPHRLGPAKILEGAELNPVITDDFILIPLPKKYDPKIVSYKLVFQALEI